MPQAIITLENGEETLQHVGGVHVTNSQPPFVTIFSDHQQPLPIAVYRADQVRKVSIPENDVAEGADPASRLLVPARLAR